MRERLPVIGQLRQLTAIACGGRDTYLRYFLGPEADARQTSRDYESGLDLSVVPLTPPGWWRRPVADWLARQICKYAQLGEGDSDRCAWILTGREVGRGPDHEPLVADPEPLAILRGSLVEQARRHYFEHFEVGHDSRS